MQQQDEFEVRRSKRIKVIEKLGIRSLLIRKILFKPPICGYKFEGEETFSFVFNKLNNDVPLNIHPQVKCYILSGFTMFCPLIHISNRKFKSSSICLEDVKEQEEIYNKRILIIYSHGNSSDLSDVLQPSLKVSTQYNVDFLGYDYTGYGLGKGSYDINEQGLYNDLTNVLSFVVTDLGYKPFQIILMGFSLGTGVTVELATRYPEIGGIILLAPISSFNSCIISRINRNDSLDLFANIQKISKVSMPCLMMHGTNDKIIDIKQTRVLFKDLSQQNQKSTFIEIQDVGHNDLVNHLFNVDHPIIQQHLYSFILKQTIQIQDQMKENTSLTDFLIIRRYMNVICNSQQYQKYKQMQTETSQKPQQKKIHYSDDSITPLPNISQDNDEPQLSCFCSKI